MHLRCHPTDFLGKMFTSPSFLLTPPSRLRALMASFAHASASSHRIFISYSPLVYMCLFILNSNVAVLVVRQDDEFPLIS